MKKLKYLFAIISAIILSFVIVGCDENKNISIGKYYSESNSESYIEILNGNKVLFVNIDFSEWNEQWKTEESILPPSHFGVEYYDVAEKFNGEPQNYICFDGSSKDGYDAHLTIEVYATDYDAICLNIHWAKSNTIYCLGNIYTLE